VRNSRDTNSFPNNSAPNGTDGVASFQLPYPDPDNDGETWYGVYISAEGKARNEPQPDDLRDR
jgi:hypothetical protein